MDLGKEYDFLTTNPLLGDNIILLGLGGSKAYGTDTPFSDTDIRGIATRTAYDILSDTRFDQVIDNPTDTTIYSLEKIINLLTNCNPNVIEILGLRQQDYLRISKYGQMLLDNRKLFLSKRAARTFTGYATAQLKKIESKTNREDRYADRAKLTKHQMHLFRLYLMAEDIFEKEEIITYREKDHDLLMSIRNGDYLGQDNMPTSIFQKMVADEEEKLRKLVEKSSLPERPDGKKIKELLYDINSDIVRNYLVGKLIKVPSEPYSNTPNEPLWKLPSVISWPQTTVPPNCRYCFNHPSNGGSGICHCINGSQTFV